MMLPQNTLLQINKIKKYCEENKPLVIIFCLTFNHEKYVSEALKGFIMQKTNFPFIAIVHDDASNDSTPQILNESAKVYPDIIKPIYETENQFTKNDGSLNEIMIEVIKKSGAKYVAFCEGDDFWTDQLKLQRQFDFMESHPDYSMCFHNASYYDQQLAKITGHFDRYPEDIIVPTVTMIVQGGGFCPSCSLFYRSELMRDYPDFAKNYFIGDLPLQIFLSLTGKIFYMAESMSVYRTHVPGSWSVEKAKFTSQSDKKTLLRKYRRMRMSSNLFENFDKYSDYKYHESFNKINNDFKCNFIIVEGIRKRLHLVKPRNKRERLKYYTIKLGIYPIIRYFKYNL